MFSAAKLSLSRERPLPKHLQGMKQAELLDTIQRENLELTLYLFLKAGVHQSKLLLGKLLIVQISFPRLPQLLYMYANTNRK